MKIEIFPSARK